MLMILIFSMTGIQERIITNIMHTSFYPKPQALFEDLIQILRKRQRILSKKVSDIETDID